MSTELESLARQIVDALSCVLDGDCGLPGVEGVAVAFLRSLHCDDTTSGPGTDEVFFRTTIDDFGIDAYLDSVGDLGLVRLGPLVREALRKQDFDPGMESPLNNVPLPFTRKLRIEVFESDYDPSPFGISGDDDMIGVVELTPHDRPTEPIVLTGDGSRYRFDISVLSILELIELLPLGETDRSAADPGGVIEYILGLVQTLAGHSGGAQAALASAVWSRVGHANDVSAMTSIDGRLWCTTRDDLLHARPSVKVDSSWRRIGHANHAVGLTSLDGRLWCATGDNGLWTRESQMHDVDWVRVGHANDATALAALDGRLWCATRDNGLCVRAPELREVNWEFVGHANEVVAMTAAVGKLFAVTRSEELWERDPQLDDIPWQRVGDAKAVVALASVGNELWAATSGGDLLVRTVP